MTAKRRIAAVERSLTAQEMVLQILGEMREFASLEDYTRTLIDRPDDVAPLNRIAAAADTSVRAAMKGASREAIGDAVRKASADGMFTFVLIFGLNGAALDIARVEGLRASATFYWMGCLMSGPREWDLEPEVWAEHQKEQAACWQSWRGVVAGLLATVVVEEDARAQLEAQYLAGQSSLLPEADAAWDRFGEMVDRMWSMAEHLVPTTKAEQRRIRKAGDSLYQQMVAERVQTLADNARITTLDRLGENRRALRILERRLTTG